MSSFPIALQAGHADDDFHPEVNLLGELVDGIVHVSSLLLNRNPKALHLTTRQKLDLARNPQSTQQSLSALISDSDALVRNELIFNPALGKDALLKLANDPDRFVSSQARMVLSLAA